MAYEKQTIDTLADVFAAWMGGDVSETKDVRRFLQESKLETILTVNDIDAIVRGLVYFPPMSLPAVYSAMPLRFNVSGGEVSLLPEEFARLNYQASRQAYPTSSLDINMKLALALQETFGEEKAAAVKREKKRRYRAKYRLEHPGCDKEYAKRRWQEEKESMSNERRESLRESWRKYARKPEVRQREREKRKQMKLENPLKVYARDDAVNHAPNRKEIKQRYYQRHKEEILAKARANPKDKEWHRKYKAKVRFRTKTGPRVLALLNGIINSKSK